MPEKPPDDAFGEAEDDGGEPETPPDNAFEEAEDDGGEPETPPEEDFDPAERERKRERERERAMEFAEREREEADAEAAEDEAARFKPAVKKIGDFFASTKTRIAAIVLAASAAGGVIAASQKGWLGKNPSKVVVMEYCVTTTTLDGGKNAWQTSNERVHMKDGKPLPNNTKWSPEKPKINEKVTYTLPDGTIFVFDPAKVDANTTACPAIIELEGQ